MENIKYYVTMTDKFMSGWGMAEGKINKLIFLCETAQEAHNVYNKAINRNEMKYINITTKKPYYSTLKYYAQTKDKNDYPSWYENN